MGIFYLRLKDLEPKIETLVLSCDRNTVLIGGPGTGKKPCPSKEGLLGLKGPKLEAYMKTT